MRGGLKPYPAYRNSGVGWLGKVPEHWDVRRLKTLSQIRYGLGQPPREAPDGLPLIRATNVTQGQIIEDNMVYVDPTDVPAGRNAFLSEGEIVVVRSGAYTADSAIIPKRYSGAVTGYDMVVTVTGVLPEFVAFAVLAAYIRDDQLTVASLRAAQPHLNAEELGSALILVPSPREQTAITRFLDHADHRIRRYIRAKERLIELLEEERQAIIYQAVTGRIDVRTGQRYPAYKDSGVEWLGEVPEHWTVRRNKWLFTERNETGFGFLPVLSVSLHQGVCVRDMEAGGRKQQMTERDRYQRAKKGDIAYNMMRMWQGAVGVVPADGLVSPAYVVMSPVDDVRSQYYEYLFRTDAYKQVVKRSSRGIVSDRDRLYWEAFKRIASIVPPMGEQAGIARFLEQADRRTSARRATAQCQIDLLREYRTCLIADVVTGKLDVRETAANLPEMDPIVRGNQVDTIQVESNLHASE